MKHISYLLRQSGYTIFAFAYFLWMALEFTVRGFFLITLGRSTPAHKEKYHQLLCKRAAFVMQRIPGATFSYSNPTGEDFSNPAVIISNHQSHLDLMAIMMLTPKIIILTKQWVWHNPFYGAIIRYADFFPVSDTEEMSRRIKAKIEQGYSVMIFPEGTRSEDCKIKRFHRGAFFLAEQLNLDIIPVMIEGFGKVLPKSSWHLHPGEMKMTVYQRIRREEITDGYRVLTKKMHNFYQEELS